MIEIVDPNDARAVRNKENVIALYDAMINRKNADKAVSQFLEPYYVQHNPLVPDSAAGLAGCAREPHTFQHRAERSHRELHVIGRQVAHRSERVDCALRHERHSAGQ